MYRLKRSKGGQQARIDQVPLNQASEVSQFLGSSQDLIAAIIRGIPVRVASMILAIRLKRFQNTKDKQHQG